MSTWQVLPAVGLSVLLVLGGVGEASAQEPRRADHEELRGLLRSITQAFNDKNFQALAPVLDREFSVTTVDQRRFTNLPEFRQYWERLFQGDRAVVRKVTIKPTADELTRFIADDVGLSSGTSEDTWEFTDGDSRVMKVRWSAVVRRSDGRWRLASVHISSDLLDNPVLEAAKRVAWRIAAGLGVAGLLVGVIAGFLIGRRPRRAAA